MGAGARTAGCCTTPTKAATYASEDYRKALAENGITCSMSRRGNVFDNAAMESWFSTFKNELDERFATKEHAAEQAFDYIEVFDNQQRRHSTLGHVSPAEYERAAGPKVAA